MDLKAGKNTRALVSLERRKGRLYIKVAKPWSYTLILTGETGKRRRFSLVNSVDAASRRGF
jgi:hypothetical protein